MPFLVPVAVALGSALVTAAPFVAAGSLGVLASQFGSRLLNKGGKTPAQTAAPGVPKPEDADAKAKAEAARRKRASGLTGGVTNVTGPLGAQAGVQDVQKKTLLGA